MYFSQESYLCIKSRMLVKHSVENLIQNRACSYSQPVILNFGFPIFGSKFSQPHLVVPLSFIIGLGVRLNRTRFHFYKIDNYSFLIPF